jgi:hypothetical protein
MRRVVFAVLGIFLAPRCASREVIRGEIAGIERLVEQARLNGAAHCAPRELEEAERQLAIAKREAADPFGSPREPTRLANESALAAYDKSPPNQCLARPVPAGPSPAEPGGGAEPP